jgi:two-component system sensor histidine kinase VanS
LKNKKPSYSMLQWKIFLRVAIFAVIALIIVAFLLYLTNQRAGNWIVSFLQNAFSLDFFDAQRIYIRAIRNNIVFVIYATFGIFFIVLIRFLMTQFAKYFNEISGGLDALVENKVDEIKLSTEMASMEEKLKTIQQTLIKRENDIKISEQRKNDVVMYLAHDIKTPLTSVIGYLGSVPIASGMV